MFGKKVGKSFLFLFWICFLVVFVGPIYSMKRGLGEEVIVVKKKYREGRKQSLSEKRGHDYDNLLPRKKTKSEQLYLPLLAVFLDSPESFMAAADMTAIENFIKAELPIVTTIPPLHQYKFNELRNEEKWEVYLNKDDTFALLLPKSFVAEKVLKGKEVLSLLGFDKNYLTLIKASDLNTVFDNDKYKNISIDLSHFDKFFIKKREGELDEPISVKMIIANGHGGLDGSQVVGIKLEQYKELLRILNNINTRFLLVQSCYVGGENLLKMHELFLSRNRGEFLSELKYPIVSKATTAEICFICSIGIEGVKKIKEFFQGVVSLIKNEQFYFGVPVSLIEDISGKRIIKRKSDVESIKEVLKYFYDLCPDTQNLPSIRMPGTNTFFRAVDVDNLLILTYVGLQKYKIAEKVKMALEEKKKLKPEPAEIGIAQIDEIEWISKVKNLPSPVLHISSNKIKRVMVYPSVIHDIILEIDDEAVPFTSHIRGDGQHFIEKLQALKLNFSDLLKKVFLSPFSGGNFYGKSNIVWFIDELECSDYKEYSKITGLVIQKGMGGKGSIVIYRQGEGDYRVLFVDLKGIIVLPDFKKIDRKEYEALVQIVYHSSRATNDALREASGGNEDENTIKEANRKFLEKIGDSEILSNDDIRKRIFSDIVFSSNMALILNRLSIFVSRGEKIEQVIAAARVGILNENKVVRNSAENLWKALFEKGYGFKEAVGAASKGIKAFDSSIQKSAINLWKVLFEKGQGFNDAIEVVSEGMRSNDGSVKNFALNLWKVLVEQIANIKEEEIQKRVFEEAIKAAADGVTYGLSFVRESAINLWKVLFEKGQGFNEAIKAAGNLTKSGGYWNKISALELWEFLFEKGQGFEEASQIDNPQLQELVKKYKPQKKEEPTELVAPAFEATEPVPAV